MTRHPCVACSRTLAHRHAHHPPCARVGPETRGAKFSFHALLPLSWASYTVVSLYLSLESGVFRGSSLLWMCTRRRTPLSRRNHGATQGAAAHCGGVQQGFVESDCLARSNAALPATLRVALCVAVRGTMLALQRRARAHALVRSCPRNTCEAQIEASGGARTTSGVVRRTIALGSGSCWHASQSCLVQRLLIKGHSDRSTGDRSGAAAESCDSA